MILHTRVHSEALYTVFIPAPRHRGLVFLLPVQMQQQELAQMRQRDANLTALAAIGPRKKRKVDSPGATPGTEVRDKTP